MGIVVALYLNWPSYRVESKSWKCLGLLMIIPDQYYRRWWRTASASQSWVCCSLLVTGDNRAFSVAGELLIKSSLRCLLAVQGGRSKNLSIGHRLFIGSSSGDCLAFLLWRAPILIWSKHLSKHSQVFIGGSSVRELLQYEMNWLHNLKPIRRRLPALFINETLSTQWHHYHCYTLGLSLLCF